MWVEWVVSESTYRRLKVFESAILAANVLYLVSMETNGTTVDLINTI